MEAASEVYRSLKFKAVATDSRMFLFFNRYLECRGLDIIMLIITQLGSLGFMVALIGGLALFGGDMKSMAIDLISILAISQAIVQSLKRLVNRPRPFEALDKAHPKRLPDCAYSFPSGHTCAALSAALVIGAGLGISAGIAVIPALLVGLSRVYLGAHYPSDVICGGAIAWMSCQVMALVL